MRLIDADVLRNHWLFNGENEHIYDTNDFLDSIDEQPTAFDKEKVIEELELHSFEFGNENLPFHYVRLEDAIEIVERGGIDDREDDRGNKRDNRQ